MERLSNKDGLEFSASAPPSIDAYEEVIKSYLGMRRDLMPKLKGLLKLDDSMPMALVLQTYLYKLAATGPASATAAKIAQRLSTMGGDVSQREQMHMAALDAWLQDQTQHSIEIFDDLLAKYPMDPLAIRIADHLHFYSGNGRRMRDSLARVLPHWPKDHPNCGFVLGMYAFGLEESGDYENAERWGREAVDLNPADAWSVHAVTHIMEMQGRHDEGIAWVKGLEPSWSTVNNFRFHLYWHRALFHLERGETEIALSLYDEQISTDLDADFNLDLCNGASLLWRLQLYGVDVGDRWAALGDYARRHLDDQELIFVSLHYLMAAISSGDAASAAQVTRTIEGWSDKDTWQGRACAEAGVDIAAAVCFINDGDYDAAVTRLRKCRYAIEGIGGSHAQRDLFELLLLHAARHGGEKDIASSLQAQRAAVKPNSRSASMLI
jgi:tetratricopeptide (TPR) repeat protein